MNSRRKQFPASTWERSKVIDQESVNVQRTDIHSDSIYNHMFSYTHTTTVRSCERNRTKCHQLMKATPCGLKLLSCQTGDWTFTSYSAKPQMCASKTTQSLKIFLCVCRSVKEELARWDHSGSPWGGRGDVRSAAGVPRGHRDQQHPHGSGHHQRVRGSSGRER